MKGLDMKFRKDSQGVTVSGRKWFAGFFTTGNCWGFRSLIPSIKRYGNGCTWFSCWRFHVSVSAV